MVQLRWYMKKKRITSEMVIDYSNKHNISPLQAKRELEGDSTLHQLQYRQIIDKTMRCDNTIVYQTPYPQVPPMIGGWEWTEWQDVPSITEYID